jgi:hypothetical protein
MPIVQIENEHAQQEPSEEYTHHPPEKNPHRPLHPHHCPHKLATFSWCTLKIENEHA